MDAIGYAIDEISAQSVAPKTPPGVPQLGGFCLAVKERDLQCTTNQLTISQGMFRALSLIIHINYVQFIEEVGCILIDDIGEGLDHDRATRLIKLLVQKAVDAGIQLIMTSNDRFVMNAIPLKYWAVLTRDGGHCQIINQSSNPKLFSEFEFTGLNNFDFFATEFWNEQAEDDK